MKETSKNSSNSLWFFSFLILFTLAFGKVYIRSQSTITGYKLGQLKKQELRLLEERSSLKMELAKISTKENLALLASTSDKQHESSASLANN